MAENTGGDREGADSCRQDSDSLVVFVVEEGVYDDRYVAGVFSTREKAEAWLAGHRIHHNHSSIQEERVDDPVL